MEGLWPKLKIFILCVLQWDQTCVLAMACVCSIVAVEWLLEVKGPFWTVIKNKNVMRNSDFFDNVLFHLCFFVI